MKKGSKKWTGVWDGLWTLEHLNRMKSAIYLFGFILSRANSSGIVKTTYQEIHKATGFPIRTLKFWKRILENEGYISVKKVAGLLITIVNFRPLNSATACPIRRGNGLPHREKEIVQELALRLHDLAPSVPATPNKQSVLPPLIRDLKENKSDIEISEKSRGQKKKKTKRVFQYSEADMEMANFILNKIQNIHPGFKKPNLESWANDVRKMRELDGRTHEEIESLFTWANADDFWQSNILSPGKFRKQWDQLWIKRNSGGNGNGYKSQADHNSAERKKVVI